MKAVFKILLCMAAALYPILVFVCLAVLRLPPRILSLCAIGLGAAFFLAATGRRGGGPLEWRPLASSAVLIVAGCACFLTRQAVFLKLYAAVISLMFLLVFGSTIARPPSICFRFATLADKSILGSTFESQVESYCKKVTLVWCAFFILNGGLSLYTALFGSDRLWSLYNGGISYAIMGVIFAIEFITRRITDKKMTKAFPITRFTADSRKDDFVICYEGKWSLGRYKTWRDFLSDSAKMRRFIAESGADSWLLHCEDYYLFLVTFVALLQCQKQALLTQNVSPNFLSEITNPPSGEKIEFLTDQKIENSTSIPQIIEDSQTLPEEEIRATPRIDGEKTRIFLYTSGSTGHPKAVPQRMKEFEEDNAFIISKWAAEFASRKLICTASQHHIYGFLFGISLPFALGVPFRRRRVEFPEEFREFDDAAYMLIATPAFLKRTVESEPSLPMRNTWIFTSGGAVSPELAVKVNEVFHFYPLEVYGSTETSGIAFRQQDKDGLEWTPFDNAKVWKGDDGCLRIISPYIRDPQGFATADLVEFLDNGKFLLNGRSDSIVKIEEKRISMTEVENRLLESGLVADAKVVALSNEVRQFLAAAVVLNEAGKKQFEGQEKFLVNRFFHDYLMKFFENVVLPKKWRFVDALPVDVQGKKHKEEIAALFDKAESE